MDIANNNIKPKYFEEPDFVANIRKTHCVGCRTFGNKCSATTTINCWLRRTYLPEGVWQDACAYDIIQQQSKQISNKIDENIIRKLKL